MGSAVGGVVGGLFGGNAPNSPNVQVFQPGGTGTADKQYQNLVTSRVNNNPYAAYAPQATATFNNAYNNPYAPGYQAAANAAGAQYGTTGANDAAASSALFGAGNTALGAGNTVLNMGFDPQNELYRRTLQQLNDQVNATEAGRGITSSPYGASIAATADSNFGIDWQNNQLTRAIQALAGYGTASSTASNDFAGGSKLGTESGIATQLAGQTPFAAASDITNNQSEALRNLFATIGNSGAGAWDTSTLGDLGSYLNLGANQSNQQGNFDLQNYSNALQAYNANQSGIGGFGAAASNILGGSDGSGYAALLQAMLA